MQSFACHGQRHLSMEVPLGPRPECECPCEFWGKRIPGGETAGPKFCVGYQLGGLEEKRKWGGLEYSRESDEVRAVVGGT